ncbi:hypothetical protein N7474_004912 [Penicillium riverlandense]|uniref:uncharacterized protein n=1 Tax=Penicillium riverlandense TaxID=1903569 RepID=UPI002549A291|nr:uncharacterized protein N7474_004912 [Penicillium riverlandense]KAJ5819321.1 hypothetical protein N7474_004912 [Penicillium riverlandense]
MSDPKNYTVGWICAITTEYVAAQAFLDEQHEGPKYLPSHNENKYTLGRIGIHNVVISALPLDSYGTSSAARVARDMLQSFPNVRICLMVGIGGGAPSPKNDIRLGDIVVSLPLNDQSSVIQYDFGKTIEGQSFYPTSFHDQPPIVLRAAVNRLQAQYEIKGHQLKELVRHALREQPRLRKRYKRPDRESDRLYQSQVVHPPSPEVGSNCTRDCGDDSTSLVLRYPRSEGEDNPAIHYGLIASANQLIKDALIRDKLAAEMGVLCFEMEAAGLMKHFPCLVIRGICDYSDSHKNKEWQGYAAIVAAAYAKDLLCEIAPQQLEREERIIEIIRPRVDLMARTTDRLDQNLAFDKLPDELPLASGAEYGSYLDQNEAECLPGTRTELLQQIEEWVSSPGGKCLFWLNGMAGTGKSTISRTVAKLLKETNQLGASFFFKGGEGDRGNATKLFPTLVRQLVLKCPGLITGVRKTLSDDPDVASKSLSEQFDKLLLQPLLNLDQFSQQPQIAVIVIDALDECKHDEDVLNIIRLLPLLQKARVVRLRVFLTSRPELPIRLGFQNIANNDYQGLTFHEISKKAMENDISLFLKDRFAKIRLERHISRDWPGNNVIHSIITFSVPSFICAVLVCRFLENPHIDPVDSLTKILPQLTEESKQRGTYSQILNRLLNKRIECERQESGDCETEYDNENSAYNPSDIESIFSTESFQSSQSSQGEITSIAISELTNLLLNDDELKLLYPIAISKVGPDRFQRNFARILRNYGRRLNGEASNEIQRQAAQFVRLSARQTSAQLRIALMQGSSGLLIGKKLVSKSAQVNAWIASQTGGRPYSNADANESSTDSDSTSSGNGHESSLGTLEEVKVFMVSTKAFPGLRQEFREWLEVKRKDSRKGLNEKIEEPLAVHKIDSTSNLNIAQG